MDRRVILAGASGGAGPYLVDVSALADANTTSATPTVPASVQTNDIVVAHAIVVGGGSDFATAPTGQGWTTIDEASTGPNTRCFWKRWGAGFTDDTTPTFDTASGVVGVALQVWRGCSASPIVVADESGATGADLTFVPDAATPGVPGCTTVIAFANVGASTVISIVSGTVAYSGVAYSTTTGTDRACACAYIRGTGPGPTGNNITASTPSSVGWNSILYALK